MYKDDRYFCIGEERVRSTGHHYFQDTQFWAESPRSTDGSPGGLMVKEPCRDVQQALSLLCLIFQHRASSFLRDSLVAKVYRLLIIPMLSCRRKNTYNSCTRVCFNITSAVSRNRSVIKKRNNVKMSRVENLPQLCATNNASHVRGDVLHQTGALILAQ